MSDSDDVDLESKEFREALLTQLNGQTEGVQRLIKLVDTRFQTHARRLREHRQEHTKQRQRIERLVLAAIAASPPATVALMRLAERLA